MKLGIVEYVRMGRRMAIPTAVVSGVNEEEVALERE